MMEMHIDGLDRVSVSFLQLQQLSKDQIWDIIAPAADTLKTRMQDVISRLFTQHSGSLRESIHVERKISKGGVVYAQVGPDQQKHPKATQGKRKRNAQGGGGGKYAGTNAEVGWILEYGSTRIPAKHWMETACNEAEEELHEQLEAGWDAAVTAAGL